MAVLDIQAVEPPVLVGSAREIKRFRPEADIWPLPSEDALKALAADIEAHGQLHPICLLDGDIIDGRSRELAMKSYTDVEPVYADVHPESPASFVISQNSDWRQPTPGQRAIAALAVEKHLAVEAKERQRIHGDTAPGRPASLPVGRREVIQGTAAALAARLTGASARYVERAKQLEKIDPEGIEEVRRGELTLNALAKRNGIISDTRPRSPRIATTSGAAPPSYSKKAGAENGSTCAPLTKEALKGIGPILWDVKESIARIKMLVGWGTPRELGKSIILVETLLEDLKRTSAERIQVHE